MYKKNSVTYYLTVQLSPLQSRLVSYVSLEFFVHDLLVITIANSKYLKLNYHTEGCCLNDLLEIDPDVLSEILAISMKHVNQERASLPSFENCKVRFQIIFTWLL